MDSAREYPSLDELVVRIAELRPLPACAIRILEVAAGDQFSAEDLATAIAADQAITARLLRLANSPYYGFPRRIASVRDAVVLLGFRAVRSAVLASSVIQTMERSTILDYRAFWHFSVTVGALAEVSARATRTHQHEAFTAGVLHNIGLLAMDQDLPDALTHSIRDAAEHQVPIHKAQQDLLGFDYADLGGALALAWSFPQPLVDAVAHHRGTGEDASAQDGLTAHVVRARLLARSYGIPDGLQHGQRDLTPAEWTKPPLSVALRHTGGMDGALERADAFLESALRAIVVS